jgi:hypothetical protein
MNRGGYLDSITDEEAIELRLMKEKAGIPVLAPFIQEIEDLIKA